MAKARIAIETAEGEHHEVNTISADYIGVNREIEGQGRHPNLVTDIEYIHRLAHRAGKRLGIIPSDVSFDDWLNSGVDAEKQAALPKEAEGESPATPAS